MSIDDERTWVTKYGIERIRDRVILVKDCLGVSSIGSLTKSSHSWYVQYTRISGSEIRMGLQIGKTIDANNRRFRIMMAIDRFLVWKWIVRFGVFLLLDWQARGRNWEIRVGWIPIQRQTCRIDHLFNNGIRESILRRWVQVVSLVGPTGVGGTVFGPISDAT